MALKDVGKIVANQAKREDAIAESQSAVTPAAAAEDRRIQALSADIKPGTSKPADVTGHKGFKYQSGNPFHEDILKTLRNSGNLGKTVIHEGGAVSFPKDVAYGLGKRFELATDFAQGGEMSFTKPSEAVVPAPRKSEKTSTKPGVRPAAPRPTKPVGPATKVAKALASDPKSEIASLFVGGNSRITPESIEMEKRKKADAEAADKAERARLRKERLAED